MNTKHSQKSQKIFFDQIKSPIDSNYHEASSLRNKSFLHQKKHDDYSQFDVNQIELTINMNSQSNDRVKSNK